MNLVLESARLAKSAMLSTIGNHKRREKCTVEREQPSSYLAMHYDIHTCIGRVVWLYIPAGIIVHV